MIKRIVGSSSTKALINNVVGVFNSSKLAARHVDYSVSVGKNSVLFTDEDDSTFRNVSLIYLKGIQAAIGNKTGNILISKKPWLMSAKRALQKISNFLEKIQPENISKAELIKTETSKCVPDFDKISQTLELNGTKIKIDITGSNTIGLGECFEPYKTL